MIFSGHLGGDPDMKYLPDGTAVVNFSVACNIGYGEHQKVLWLRVSAFGNVAEACNEHLRKGSGVLVEGELNPGENGSPRVWEGNDGEARASYEVRAFKIVFGSRPSEGQADGPTRKSPF
jgi:single-strand DNA-binding protein